MKSRRLRKLERRILANDIQHERELREAAIKAIDHERELRVISDKHEYELRLSAEHAVEKARQIQFTEYERRLMSLNHAHEQAVEAQRSTVPREMFEAFVKDNERRLAKMEAMQSSIASRREGSSAAIGWVFATIAAAASLAAVVGFLISRSP